MLSQHGELHVADILKERIIVVGFRDKTVWERIREADLIPVWLL